VHELKIYGLLKAPSVFRRYRTLVAMFAIALQAMDGLVAIMGHSHREKHNCSESGVDSGHLGACEHGHVHSVRVEHEAEDEHESVPHDDCALCRHVSQPVLAVSLAIEIVGCQASETVVLLLFTRLAVFSRPIYPARGPPPSAA
jgi:hypothetical protein